MTAAREGNTIFLLRDLPKVDCAEAQVPAESTKKQIVVYGILMLEQRAAKEDFTIVYASYVIMK